MSRVLVIDDERCLRVTFKHILEEEGYEVYVAEDGKSGLEACREVHPDLVITDILMPIQDGFATIDLLNHEFPKLPILAMSAAADSAGIDQALRSGATTFVQKPVDIATLVRLVSELLALRTPSRRYGARN